MSIATWIADIFGHHHDIGFGWELLMVLFWVLLIFGVIRVLRGRLGIARVRDSDAPGEILKRRLAAGEVSVEDYERRKALLESDASSGRPSREGADGRG